MGAVLGTIPIAMAWVYYVGRSYLESYYAEMGADYSFIQPGLYDIVLTGALGQAGVIGGAVLLFLFMLAFIVVVAFTSRAVSAVVERDWRHLRLMFQVIFSASAREALSSKRKKDLLVEPPESFPVVIPSIALLLFLAFSIQLAAHYGAEFAKSDMAGWRSPESANRMVRVTVVSLGESQDVAGWLIGCGDGGCAIWGRGGVTQISRSSIVSIWRKEEPRL